MWHTQMQVQVPDSHITKFNELNSKNNLIGPIVLAYKQQKEANRFFYNSNGW